jgi:glutathione synthase/RimK-type ligase-like ATP-grasp enzyme
MILIVSFPGDEHTAEVVGRLERAGRELVQIDLADFPATGLAMLYGQGSAPPSYLVDTGRGAVDLAGCQAGWWRRVRPFQLDPAMADTHDRAFAASETGQAVLGLLDSLPCAWMNPPRMDEAAHRKPLQWAAAREAGLRLPRTVVTNRPEQVRAFVQELGGPRRVVFKAFIASELSWRETRLLRDADLAQLEAVRLAPVIFQEYVPGVDLRVTIVGEQVFAAEIDATGTSYPVDMRMVVGEAGIRPAQLPPLLEQALLGLMRRLGLVYGALDLRRTPDGEHVFFEVNPAGQWLFVEQRTGLPISDAVAAMLACLDAPQIARSDPPGSRRP